MELRFESATGTPVAPLPELLAGIAQQLDHEQQTWLQCLLADPHQFSDVEVAVHHTFQQLADQVVAGLLATVSQRGALAGPCKKSH
jgi:hypothetical protein